MHREDIILETQFSSTPYMKAEGIKIMRESLLSTILECRGFGGATLS